jgi:hypothetical protein
MIRKTGRSKLPREAWTHERLLRERAIAIACAVEPSSASSYSSAVKSYFDFCTSHSLPVEPTPDTLSFFAVYMAHHIKPKSVLSYLSGICNQLEPFFPDVRSHRRHWLVTKTLAGCRKMLPSTMFEKGQSQEPSSPTLRRSMQPLLRLTTLFSSLYCLRAFTDSSA